MTSFHVRCDDLPNVSIGMSAETEAGVRTRQVDGTCHMIAVASQQELPLVHHVNTLYSSTKCLYVSISTEVCALICIPAI